MANVGGVILSNPDLSTLRIAENCPISGGAFPRAAAPRCIKIYRDGWTRHLFNRESWPRLLCHALGDMGKEQGVGFGQGWNVCIYCST